MYSIGEQERVLKKKKLLNLNWNTEFLDKYVPTLIFMKR